MRIWILPNAREADTLHALKDRGLSISTIKTRRGTQRNVADRVPVLTNVVELNRSKSEKGQT